MDLNNRNIGTISNKIRKIGLLSSYVTDKICTNGKIKRYLYYNSPMPLSPRAKGYDGKTREQGEILETLEGTYIFDGLFDDKIKDEEKNQIYINIFEANLNEPMGRVYINIDVLCCNDFVKLASKGEKRHLMILQEISNIFDNTTIDNNNASEDEISELGNLTFRINPKFRYGRISNMSKTNIATIRLEVDITTMRIKE